MPVQMEITSIEYVNNDSTRGKESSEDDKGDSNESDRKQMVEGEFYDALEKSPSEEKKSKKKPSWKQQKMMKRMKKALLKLKNGG